jgi:CO dehydrogenase/acetyl-CoA synthase beta subunit
MATSKSFTQAWFEWQRSAAPIANFRLERTNAPTYRIEHDLDHLTSYVHALGLKALGNETVDFANLASQEFAELERISGELDRCSISEGEKKPFAAYISATRRVLEELIETQTRS